MPKGKTKGCLAEERRFIVDLVGVKDQRKDGGGRTRRSWRWKLRDCIDEVTPQGYRGATYSLLGRRRLLAHIAEMRGQPWGSLRVSSERLGCPPITRLTFFSSLIAVPSQELLD